MAKAPFQDPDLHTPAHDAIMMWLEENACTLIHDLLVSGVQRNLGLKVRPLECATDWEVKYYGNRLWTGQYGNIPRMEYSSARFIDMVITSWADEKNIGDRGASCIRLACEIKPVIRSAGELIRQLRQYENYDWKVAVVSPDDRFRAIIEKQGFIFIKAPQPEYGPQGGLF